MAPNIFATGVTGYIGGDALFEITQAHPDWALTCLVRNSDKGAKVAAQYPKVRLVYGDLDSSDLIEEESSKADVSTDFANCDHEPSARAITKGLSRRQSQTPGYWIHTSGSFVLGLETLVKNSFGTQTKKVFDDWEGINELTSLPDEAPHRNVDKIVLDASATHSNIKTGIVCPCTIYGVGRGPDNQNSMQLNMTAAAFLKSKRAIQVGRGENTWNYVHVRDLSKLYLSLGEAALAGGSPATWNEQGYYLAENGEYAWGDAIQHIATAAHKKGLLPIDKVDMVSANEADALADDVPFHMLIGSNSRGTAIRAKRLLAWSPKERPIMETVPEVVEIEAKKLGLLKGHAQKIEEASK